MGRSIEIFTDGSANNHTKGAGGYGIVMINYSDTSELVHTPFASFRARMTQYAGGSYYSTTSARMEMRGLIEAIKKCQVGDQITVWMDCKWIVDAIVEGWVFNWEKVDFVNRDNEDLWREFLKQYRRLRERVNVRWLKGHAKIAEANYYNHVADILAARGGKRENKIKDK